MKGATWSLRKVKTGSDKSPDVKRQRTITVKETAISAIENGTSPPREYISLLSSSRAT